VPRPRAFVQTKSGNYFTCNWLVPLTLGAVEKSRGAIRWPTVEKETTVAVAGEFKGFGGQKPLQVIVSRCAFIPLKPSQEYALRKGHVRANYAANPFRCASLCPFKIALHRPKNPSLIRFFNRGYSNHPTPLRKCLSVQLFYTPRRLTERLSSLPGPYRRIFGPLEANAEIEFVGDRVRRKPERFKIVTGEPLGRFTSGDSENTLSSMPLMAR